jgi:hypothetical protein
MIHYYQWLKSEGNTLGLLFFTDLKISEGVLGVSYYAGSDGITFDVNEFYDPASHDYKYVVSTLNPEMPDKIRQKLIDNIFEEGRNLF